MAPSIESTLVCFMLASLLNKAQGKAGIEKAEFAKIHLFLLVFLLLLIFLLFAPFSFSVNKMDPQIESSTPSAKKKRLDFFESMMTGEEEDMNDSEMDMDLAEFGLEEDKNVAYSDDEEDLMNDDELT